MSADAPKLQKKFVEKHGFQFSMLCDEDHETLAAYGVWRLKKNFGKEHMGIVRSSYLIDEEGKIKHVFKKVKTQSHALDVLNFMGM